MSSSRRDFLKKMLSISIITASSPHFLLGKIEPTLKNGKGDHILGTYTIGLLSNPDLEQYYKTVRFVVTFIDGSSKRICVIKANSDVMLPPGKVYNPDCPYYAVWELCPHQGNPIENFDPETYLWVCKKGHGSQFFVDGTLFHSTVTLLNLESFTVTCDGNSVILTNDNFTSVGDDQPQNLFYLNQNYPNPCSEETTLYYGIEKEDNVQITLYNMRGEKVLDILNSRIPAGHYEKIISVESLVNGIYMLKMTTSTKSVFVKLIVSR